MLLDADVINSNLIRKTIHNYRRSCKYIHSLSLIVLFYHFFVVSQGLLKEWIFFVEKPWFSQSILLENYTVVQFYGSLPLCLVFVATNATHLLF